VFLNPRRLGEVFFAASRSQVQSLADSARLTLVQPTTQSREHESKTKDQNKAGNVHCMNEAQILILSRHGHHL
jgi:ribosomal protein L19E